MASKPRPPGEDEWEDEPSSDERMPSEQEDPTEPSVEQDEWFLRMLEEELEDGDEEEGAVDLTGDGDQPKRDPPPGAPAPKLPAEAEGPSGEGGAPGQGPERLAGSTPTLDKVRGGAGGEQPGASRLGQTGTVAGEVASTSAATSSKRVFKRPNRARKRKAVAEAGTPRPPSAAIPSLVMNDCPPVERAASVSDTCPPHPGFLRGLCIRCGELQPAEVAQGGGRDERRSTSLRYIHTDLEVNKEYVRELKHREASRLIAQKKLSLVFDLDHTLLNSSALKDITNADLPLLHEVVSREAKSKNQGPGCTSLFVLHHIQMWTKLRPFYRKLLEECSKLFDMHVYTMGERGYAMEMVRLLDPDKSFFGDHVVSKNDSTSNSVKDLDVLIGSEKSVLILDDSPKVWHRHRANVLEIERYHYFPSSLRHFGMKGKCLLERRNDESPDCGPLSSVLKILKAVHAEYFSRPDPEASDVRELLKRKKRDVLIGCKLCFSRVIPKAEEKQERHPIWRLAEEFGAVCTRFLDSSVTHLVTTSEGTEKSITAAGMGIHVVRPDWVHASAYHFSRAAEERYGIRKEEKKMRTGEAEEAEDVEEGEIVSVDKVAVAAKAN